MRWIRTSQVAVAAVAVLAAALLARSADDQRLAVFAPQARYTVPVVEREGTAYVPVLELVEPLAATQTRVESDKIRIRAGKVEAEFRPGRTRAKIGRGELELGAKVVVEGDRVLVPLHTVPLLLSRLLGVGSDLHERARRLLIEGAAIRFNAALRKGDPPALVLNFTAPVNPMVSTEPGKLRLTFARDAVVSGTETLRFDDAPITGASYREAGGQAEFEVTAKAPLTAEFADGGKTIVITALPVAATSAPAPADSAAAPAQAPAPGEQPGAPPVPMFTGQPRHRFLIVIDAAHGGDDPGAKLSDKLLEKDVTLAFARRLRAALAERGINAQLVRDGDTTLSYEQRAAAANGAHATVYVGVHAGTPGSSARLYTSLLPEAQLQPAAFQPWNSAQAAYLLPSRIVAQAAVEEFGKRKLPVVLMPANIRPLSSVAAAAIAVELAPPHGEADRIASGRFQEPLATALAAAIANAREPLERPR